MFGVRLAGLHTSWAATGKQAGLQGSGPAELELKGAQLQSYL